MKENNDRQRDSEGLGITIVETESLISVRQAQPPLLGQTDLVAIGTPEAGQLGILVGPDAYQMLDAHVASEPDREVGGFLVGRPYQWENRLYVEVTGALPGEETSSSAAHLTISADTWARAQAAVRQRFPNMHIVGWYHTHPRFHVFMSSQDLAIHEGFFREPWHVSLVIDPSRRDAGFFVWDKGGVTAAKGYHIAYPSDTPSEKRWHVPHPIDAELDIGTLSLEEFYEPGYWRTRWAEADELAVKVSEKAMSLIARQGSAGSGAVIGLCLGVVHPNLGKRGPRYFVEVIDALRALDGDLVRELDPSSIGATWQNLLASAKQNDRLQLVGWYWLQPPSESSLRGNYRYAHQYLFREVWKIILVGDKQHGVKHCEWQAANGDFISRQLVQMVALGKPSAKEMEKVLAAIKNFLPKSGSP